MNDKELAEAGEILVHEVEHWEKPEFGNVISSLNPAGKKGFDCRVQIIFHPVSWRGHKDGERIATDFYVRVDPWNGQGRDQFREGVREALKMMTEQWKATMRVRVQEGME